MKNMYLVYPKGYESHLAIIISENSESAITKALKVPHIAEMVDMGASVMCIDVNKGLAPQGYAINVYHTGMYN